MVEAITDESLKRNAHSVEMPEGKIAGKPVHVNTDEVALLGIVFVTNSLFSKIPLRLKSNHPVR
ncbi:MAG: hypothetical protein WDO71_08650 [Bacteroidota bacterium]